MILTQEALFEERIGRLAEEIISAKDRKFIMIAGPSSSGKTTFHTDCPFSWLQKD